MKRSVCEIFDQAPVEVRLRGEVELLERLARRQLGEPQPALQAALLDRLDLMVEQVVQELGVGRLVALGRLERSGELVGDGGEPQVVQVPAQLLVDGVGHQDATSASSA